LIGLHGQRGTCSTCSAPPRQEHRLPIAAGHGGYDDATWPGKLTLLGALAEFERELIRSRTTEGRERSEGEGRRHWGRKPKLRHHQRQEAVARRHAGEALVDFASYAMSHSTIRRL
jgi:DNA invertase Pin-like site-specific DNA recombinase